LDWAIASGDFAGHRLRFRGQKARLLPAALRYPAAAISADISFVAADERRVFAGCAAVPSAAISVEISVAAAPCYAASCSGCGRPMA
jgi:hypothetical protein